MADDGDDDDFFASLGIISVPKDEPVRPSSSCGRPSTGGGAGAGAPASSWGFADGGEVDNAAQLFAPLPLLWHEIRSALRPAEVDEVAAVIGSDLIDRNEGLYKEAMAFAEILRDFHSENALLKEAVARRPRLGATRTHKLLGQQIKLLLSSIHRDSRPATPVAAPSTPRLVETPREQAVVAFATGDAAAAAALATPRNRAASLSRASSFRGPGSPGRRPSSSHTTHSAPDRIKSVMGRVSAFNVDKIRDEFRAALQDEYERLHDDISFLQDLLEEENTVRKATAAQANAPSMPSVSDLRAYESKLQKVLSEKELRERTDALLLNPDASASGAGPGSPARTPKLAPLGTSLMPSPPPGTKKRDHSSNGAMRGGGRGRSARIARTNSGNLRRGRPPVPPMGDVGLRAATGGNPASGAGDEVQRPAMAPLKKVRSSRAHRLRAQVSESRHLT